MLAIKRQEQYRGRTTPDVTWLVTDESGKVFAESKTRREALEWLDIYTLTKEQVWAKYPHLKP